MGDYRHPGGHPHGLFVDAVESCWLRQPARGDRGAPTFASPAESSAAASAPEAIARSPSGAAPYDQARPAPLLIVHHGYTGSGSGRRRTPVFSTRRRGVAS